MKTGFSVNLEALRGFAAIFVVFGHLLGLGYIFSPGYLPTLVMVFAPSAHLAVLVFFVLSGCVITASNQEIATGQQIGAYMRKRFIRIYPIYFVAILLTVVLGAFHDSGFAVFGNLLLLQGTIVSTLTDNGPAWSLHYEVIYYLLFIPIVFFRFNFKMVFILTIAFALGTFYFNPSINIHLISPYLFGFSFWIGGACIAKYLLQRDEEVSYSQLLAMLFFLLSIDQLLAKPALSAIISHTASFVFKLDLSYPDNVNLSNILLGYKDLIYLPYCLYVVLIFSGRKFRYEKFYFLVLQLPLLYAIYLTLKGPHQAHFVSSLVPLFYYTVSLLLQVINLSFVNKIGKQVVNTGSWLGGISYGIYIIHAPILYCLGKMEFSIAPKLSYVIKVIALMAIVTGLAYLLEKVFQPWIKKILSPKNRLKHF